MLQRIVRQRPGPHAYQRPAASPQPRTSPPYTDAHVDRLLLAAAGLTKAFHLSRYTEFLPDPPAAEVLSQLRG